MRGAVPVLLVSIFACGGRSPAAPPPNPSSTPTPPTSTPSPGVTLQRLDPSAECDGLLPASIPPSTSIARTPPAGATCAGGLSDGTGHVAVAALDGAGASWQVFGPDGTLAATFSAWPVVAEPAGWQGLAITAASGGVGPVVSQVALGPDGSVVGSTTVSQDPSLVDTTGWTLAGDPLGGSLALLAQLDRFHNHWSGLRALRFDAAGAPRWPDAVQFGARSDRILFLTAGVSRQGEALALWQQSAYLDLSWRDASGAEIAAAELTERYPDVLGTDALDPVLELVPLLDGSLALRAQGSFRRVYPRLATRSAPLPAWLADRAAWSLRFTRGNAGYALFPPPGQTSQDCAQTIELRAPSGRLCGQVILRPEQAGACTTGAVDQGWDGTVIQQSSAGACRWRFWPGLLAR